MSNHEMARAWVEVNLGAVRANFETVRRLAGDRAAVVAMVKADGYGLGAVRIVRALEPLGPWGYGVAAVAEGAQLRRIGVTRPIVVFTPLPPGLEDEAAGQGLTATISDIEGLDRWRAAAERSGRPLDMHVEIDTGMGRAGFDWRDTPNWSAAVRTRCGSLLSWAGVYTHFHGADSADPAPTQAQWERFKDALAQLPVSREDLMVHAANSAAALRFREMSGDAVRPGIFLYGGHPVDRGVTGVEAPREVAAVRARLVLVRDVPSGSTVGYGATHAARGWERWGTLAIGYGDGLPRALGNRGEAIVLGRRVPIVGRVSMDMTVVDLTSVPEADCGDVVTLIGSDAGEQITVDEVAAQVGTISYEILTGLTPRLTRVEVGGGELG
jgi:alanine racemase